MRILALLFLFCLSAVSSFAQPLPPPPPNQSIPLDAVSVLLIVVAVVYAAYKLRVRQNTSVAQ